jgi:hypothetical protein
VASPRLFVLLGSTHNPAGGGANRQREARIVSLPNVLLNLLLEATPKVGKVFSDTNLRTEWEKACAACGLGTRAKIEGKDYRCHEGLKR